MGGSKGQGTQRFHSFCFLVFIITWVDDIHGTCDVSRRVLVIICVCVLLLYGPMEVLHKVSLLAG